MSRTAGPNAGKGKHLKTRYVRHELDLANPPSLTADQKAEITAIKALPDDQIDRGDIPALDDQFWKAAAANFYCRRAAGLG